MIVSCVKYYHVGRGRLQALCNMEFKLGGVRMILSECKLYKKGDARWLSYPAKEFRASDGSKRWIPQFTFLSTGDNDDFQALALDAIDEYLESERGYNG